MVELRSRPRTTAAESTYSGFGTFKIMNSGLQSLATLNSDFHYEGNTEESSTTQNSQWSNWKNASHNIVQVSDQEEKLCRSPSGIPNSCLRRQNVLGDIPTILAISTQRNPNTSLSPWICSCLISYLRLSALPDLSRVNNFLKLINNSLRKYKGN